MGRDSYSNRLIADHFKNLRMSSFKKWGYLSGLWIGKLSWKDGFETELECMTYTDIPCLRLVYYSPLGIYNAQERINSTIFLTSTPCNYGGKRYWFICPLFNNGAACGKRVGVLYKVEKYFGCRHCFNLTYDSRRENRKYKHYPLFFVLNGYDKIDRLENQIKRRQYAGKPTKKQMQLERIGWRMAKMAPLVMDL